MNAPLSPSPLKKSILIHYSEISLKKKNRPFFEKTLIRNIQQALNISDHIKIHSGCFTFTWPESLSWDELKTRLQTIFGIHSFSVVYEVPRDIELLKSAVLAQLKEYSFESFGVLTKRADKTFSLNSQQISIELGGAIQDTFQKKVNLTQPDLWIKVEVLHKMLCFTFQVFSGSCGLPVGVSGRSCCLLSGGIDSPVAAIKMMSRGSPVSFVHFHSFPFTQAHSIEKVEQLLTIMTRYQNPLVVYMVPFAELQQEIVALGKESLRVLLYRRFMFRIAEALAKKEKAQALITGESLGQVASQTMENIAAVDRIVELPIFRPLIGLSKEEIITYARTFDTYETSILPHEDCCTFLMPKNPSTHSSHFLLSEAEKEFPVEQWVQKMVEKAERKIISHSS